MESSLECHPNHPVEGE